MNLPEHLKKKRDEVGELFDRSSWYGRRSMDYFDAGFDAACAELLPMIEKLDSVMHELSDLVDDTVSGEYKPDRFTTQPAKIALAELNKWRES